jgi:glucose-6-phosphate dehydrogenase assembly protein OpcA
VEDVVTTPALARARTATLVIAGPAARLSEAIDIVGTSDEDVGSLHIVRISTGGGKVEDGRQDVVTIEGLRPEYLDNAIAALRLSSLPTVVWWRGGSPERLDGAARLVDRIVIDVDDPWPVWQRMPPLFESASLTDIRWARLTRWRAAMAHFFDMPAICQASPSFRELLVTGRDGAQCALFAGWLEASLGWKGRVAVRYEPGESADPMQNVTLGGPNGELHLQLLPNTICLNTQARLGGKVIASRVVSLGDQGPRTLLAEELRVRSRDLAFEQALERALQDPGARHT